MGEVGLGGGQVGVGHKRVIAPHREQGVGVAGIFDAAHDQPGGDGATAAQPQGVGRFGDLGVGDQRAGVRVSHRARVVHRLVGVVVDALDCGADALVSAHRQGEFDALVDAGGDHLLAWRTRSRPGP